MQQFYTGDPQPKQPVEDLVARTPEPQKHKIVSVKEVSERGYPLMAAEAQQIKMWRHPRQYLGHVSLLETQMHLQHTGWGLLPLPGELNRLVQVRDDVEEFMGHVLNIESPKQQGDSVG